MEQRLIQNERLAAMGRIVAARRASVNDPLTAVLGVTDSSAIRRLTIPPEATSTSLTARPVAPLGSCRAFWRFRAPQPREICLNLSDSSSAACSYTNIFANQPRCFRFYAGARRTSDPRRHRQLARCCSISSSMRSRLFARFGIRACFASTSAALASTCGHVAGRWRGNPW